MAFQSWMPSSNRVFEAVLEMQQLAWIKLLSMIHRSRSCWTLDSFLHWESTTLRHGPFHVTVVTVSEDEGE